VDQGISIFKTEVLQMQGKMQIWDSVREGITPLLGTLRQPLLATPRYLPLITWFRGITANLKSAIWGVILKQSRIKSLVWFWEVVDRVRRIIKILHICSEMPHLRFQVMETSSHLAHNK